jgi:DNA-binding response OmpR family regulator
MHRDQCGEMMSEFTPRVLYVEDDADSRDMIALMLRKTWDGCAVALAADGVEAARVIESDSFDLYILDVWLPDIDGFELCRRIRRKDRVTPIMFFSAFGRATECAQAYAAGGNAYLRKPDDLDIFPKMISKLLNDSHKENVRFMDIAEGLA